MSPELSRRVGKLMNTPTVMRIKRGGGVMLFINEIEDANSFEGLSPATQRVIVEAERDIAEHRIATFDDIGR